MTAGIQIPAIAADGSLYSIDKMQAHVDGVLHLAVSVFIFDGDRLLIQKRASTKYHCSGQWANTCCTHPHWNESLEICAERRLQEELGFTVPLTRHQTVEYAADVGSGLREHERVTLFSAEVDSRSLDIRPAPSEVDAVRWVSLQQLRLDLIASPQDFTPWLRIYLQRFPGLTFRHAA
ncbi:isopentenyl-diphosphate delta-isomerase [Rhizobium sp. RU36D]|uniref:isopentenyl-diphosphate delta-isomerase n=1 Tax=Rhizobium sp. RU36D TaxID=1907415 RepID=UPI0009D7CE42|nr:isopentenyl-diphosphate delta-isomerase [Rhizobium sp. RU36D]SMC53391.1 isopentenyl-diphosphate delta-isomerase [Rhizobium sp. RU36D]